MAGESAQEVARKQREKAASLNRVADAYEKGADGERRTADALTMLPASGWFVLHDVRWPGKRFANIDHVVVGPGGVFVIDSKAWSGVVEVRNGVLRQNGYNREAAVASAADAVIAVGERVPGLAPYAVKPVLCFAGDQGIEGHVGGVILCTTGTLVAMLLSRPQVLNAPAVRRTLLGLQEALKAATAAPDPSPRRTTPRTTRPAKGRSLNVGGAAVRLLALAGFVALGFLALVVLPKLAPEISKAITPSLPAAHSAKDGPPLGARQSLPAGPHRPPLRVTADHAITAHRIGTTPYLFDGNRFFAVRLTIKNVGKRPWVSLPGTAVQAVDSYNTPRSSEGAMRIRKGRVLPETIRLAPGHMMRGYVVFQLGKTMPVTAITLSVGPGTPYDVSWVIDRQ